MLRHRITATLILALVLLVASLGTAAAEESGAVVGVETSGETALARWVVLPQAPLQEETATPTSTPTPTPTSTSTPTSTPTPTEPASPIGTPTPEFCHPVARMIARFFDLTCAEVTELHDGGLGFGVIARAYLTAQALGEETSPEAILALHQAGVGWGQIMQQFGAAAHPGGKGLGAIMRGKSPDGDGDDAGGATGAAPDRIRPGNSGNAPGHNQDDGPRGPDRGKGSDKPKGRPW
ncbi:MAG TPA: hypothetical protein VJ793_24915 [Anaerolineae bacterium]|nr:hypothetical protein [Anaerolineae bacterium]